MLNFNLSFKLKKSIAHFTSKTKIVCYLFVHENLYAGHPLAEALIFDFIF